MSLLVDLLSKVKHRTTNIGGQKSNVPPDLKRLVSNSTERETVKRKIIVLSVLILFAIIAGIGAIYIVELYIKPSAIKTVKHQKTEDRLSDNRIANVQNPESRLQSSETLEPQKPEEQTDAAIKPVTIKPMPAKEQILQKKAKQKTALQQVHDRHRKEEPQATDAQSQDSRGESREHAYGENRPTSDVQRPTHSGQKPTGKDISSSSPQTYDPQRDIYLYTARTYESRKDYQQALVNYKKALETDANNYIIMNNISGVLIHLGSIEEAVRYAKNALAVKNDYVPSLINLGIAYIRLGNTTEGEGYLSKALSIEPSNNYALLNLGILYEKRGDNEKAYSYFSKLSEMGNLEGYLGIARIAEKQGRISEAVRIYKDMLSKNNIDPRIRKFANERLLQLGK